MGNKSGLYPANTVIKDFAYTELNPLRHGKFEVYDEHYQEMDWIHPDENDADLDDSDPYSVPQDNIEINQRAIALFDFDPENDNEVALTEGQIILISYRHGQGWLVAEDPNTGENGLVPEEYVQILSDSDDLPKPFPPDMFQHKGEAEESEWIDTDEEEDNVDDILGDIQNIQLRDK